jgi:hypothetical protein
VTQQEQRAALCFSVSSATLEKAIPNLLYSERSKGFQLKYVLINPSSEAVVVSIP